MFEKRVGSRARPRLANKPSTLRHEVFHAGYQIQLSIDKRASNFCTAKQIFPILRTLLFLKGFSALPQTLLCPDTLGFIGAGLIVQDGGNVRGLTTAASVWACAVIGILFGTTLYVPAVGLTGLLSLDMATMPTVERILPAHTALTVKVHFTANYRPQEDTVSHFALKRRLTIPPESFLISYEAGRCSLQFLIVADPRRHANVLAQLSTEFQNLPHVESFSIARSTT
ncbi:hypothetical protein A6V36_25770 [Paraburkholderia ginsengiterrae]|uniref:Protein MgtC n=2 Tax=Paraburkholderia ginsengiterrae TaxID=1462993 RepID=A0A1A9NBY2_9BURK|nr:hypothetical protein A6V36_25770 [Paraburkholderia ginsengiterrae]OAJ63244.1 hypothetical protein A6V37_21600 [Paraburkholderia ginsengiterrae]